MIRDTRRRLVDALFRWYPSRRLWQYQQLRKWQATNKSSTSPALVKQRIVRDYARRFSCRILVETGTLFGDMLYANRRSFQSLYSIELDSRLYRQAEERFKKNAHIHLLSGDSCHVLKNLLPKLDRPTLFWLDAHQMVGGVRGELLSPIVRELDEILSSSLNDYVLLIDDARLFTGGDYPTVDEVRGRILEAYSDWVFEIEHDVIRSHRA